MTTINVGKIKPIREVDYWTEEDKGEIFSDVTEYMEDPLHIETFRGRPAQMQFTDAVTGEPGSQVIVQNLGTETQPILKLTIPQGLKGETGDPFTIDYVYHSIAEMKADTREIPNGKFAIIGTNEESVENGMLFCRDNTISDPDYGKWVFIADISGAQGIQGPKGTMEVISTETITPGSPASVVDVSEEEGHAKLKFYIPKGEKGDQGNAGEIISATASTLEPGSPVEIELGGTTSQRTMNFKIPQGIQGEAGEILSATATKIAPDQNPEIVLGGTTSQRTMEFKIPQGIKGDTGPLPTISIDGTTTTTEEPQVEWIETATGGKLHFWLKTGPKGDKGDTGNGFVLHGLVATPEELPETGKDGDAWAVGTKDSNEIYIWDIKAIPNQWRNIGTMSSTWNSITGKPDTFPPSSHSHTIIDLQDSENPYHIKNLKVAQNQIDNFSSHTHIKNQITDFAHSHAKGDIVDFNQHEHTISQITDLNTQYYTKSEVYSKEESDTNYYNKEYLYTKLELDAKIPTAEKMKEWDEKSKLTEGTDYLNPTHIQTINNLTNYYTSTQTDAAIAYAISQIPKFSILVVDVLPSLKDASMTTFYLLKVVDTSGKTSYDEYICVKFYTEQQKTDSTKTDTYINESIFNSSKTLYAIKVGDNYQDCTEESIYDPGSTIYYKNRKWEKIGNLSIDLSGYATEDWVRNQGYALQSDLNESKTRITTLETETCVTKILKNYSVDYTKWNTSTTYAEYPWYYSVPFEGCTTDYYPEVIFDINNDMRLLAPVSTTGTNVVYIYASEKPTINIPISVVKIWKMR